MNFIKRGMMPMLQPYRNIFNPYKGYHITVEPRICLHDVPVSIRATGLKPNENATITVTTENDKGEGYFSYAYFKADSCGCIDVESDSSIGGMYKGCLPMGLISALQHTQNDKKHEMFIKRRVEVPMKLNINLLRGFMGREKCAGAEKQDFESSASHERHFIPSGGVRIPVKHGRVRGTLFIPPGKGPFPGVIDMHGSKGGINESRAAQLSAHGFATFSLAYFRYDDLPTEPTVIDLEYFEEAIQFFLQQDKVSSGGVAVLGSSMGSEISIAMAIYLKHIKAVVAISGIPVVAFWPLKYKDLLIPAIVPDLSTIKPQDGKLFSRDIIEDSIHRPESVLPIEKVKANVLFIIGKDDQTWYPVRETRRATERMREHGLSNYEVMELDGTGHIIEPPFNQFCDRMYHHLAQNYIGVGGILDQHTLAEQVAWTKTIQFLNEKLTK